MGLKRPFVLGLDHTRRPGERVFDLTNIDLHLAADVRQVAKMVGENDADHSSSQVEEEVTQD